MAFSEFELKQCERDLEVFMQVHRPPVHVRDQLDWAYRISGQSIELVEIRPAFARPGEKMESAFAKFTYVRTSSHWRIYWMRQDLKWHGYEPCPNVQRLTQALAVVREDAYGCFLG